MNLSTSIIKGLKTRIEKDEDFKEYLVGKPIPRYRLVENLDTTPKADLMGPFKDLTVFVEVESVVSGFTPRI